MYPLVNADDQPITRRSSRRDLSDLSHLPAWQLRIGASPQATAEALRQAAAGAAQT
jgi:hypothetical protein